MVCKIVIDGLIGSGKSTFLEELANMGYTVHKQPVEEWTCLKPFYENPSKYAYQLQEQVLQSYANIALLYREDLIDNSTQKDAVQHKDNVVFFESFGLASVMTFAKMLNDDGLLSSPQWINIASACKGLLCPDVFVFIKTTVDECLNRIYKRKRDGEENIKVEYLMRLEKYYEAFMVEFDQSFKIRYISNEENDKYSTGVQYLLERYVKKNPLLLKYAIEGNIGSGKTTYLEYASKVKNQHQVRQFINNRIAALLKDRYDLGTGLNQIDGRGNKKQQITFKLQMEFIKMYAHEMHNSDFTKDNNWEGVLSLIHVFSFIAMEDGLITNDEFNTLKREYSRYGLPEMWEFEKIVFLCPIVTELRSRITLRDRPGEEFIELEYLNRVHSRYCTLFHAGHKGLIYLNNTYIDAAESFDLIHSEVN